jgi:hypothetical protein
MSKMLFLGPTFTLEVPTDWFVMATPQYQAVFTDPQEVDGFQANVAIAIRPVEEQVSITAVAESAKLTQTKEYPAYRVLEEETFDQIPPAIKRTYVWHHPKLGTDIKQTQYFYLQDDRLYTLTATRLAESANVDSVDDIVNHMIDTFTMRTN